MSIRINSVILTPQEVTVGQTFTVLVAAEEVIWENLSQDFADWGEVRRSFTNWNKVKNYIYSIPNPTPDSNAVYTSDSYALFDVDGNQISISGGYSSQYSATTIRDFMREVNDG